MGIAVRDEGSKVNSNINVTPMVDVMLVLLIIFMIIAPMLNNKVNVNLYSSKNAIPLEDASKDDAAIVAVTRDGRVYLGKDQISLDQLGAAVQTKLQSKINKVVYFRADSRAHYGTVEDAIDAVRTVGIEQIAMLTEQNSPSDTGPGGM
jgi:biopolymer transport protein TolR